MPVAGRCVGLVLDRLSVALTTATVVAQTVCPAVLGRLIVVVGVIVATVVAATVFVAASSVVAASLIRFFISSEHGISGCSLGFVGGKLGLKGPEFRVTTFVAGS